MKQHITNNQNQAPQPLWGKQTALSLTFFNISTERFSSLFIDCLINVKRACAEANQDNGLLNEDHARAILATCDELVKNDYIEQFPLSVWQTGSGTQTNMNVNEVISSLANKQLEERSAHTAAIHPNDHVNMSQSSNDVFPTAMHLVTANLTEHSLLKSLEHLYTVLHAKEIEFEGQLTVGRTHMMDALPMPVSALLSGFCAQLQEAKVAIKQSLDSMYELAIGGTAVGGGDNAPAHFGPQVALKLANQYLLPFKASTNTYAAISGEDAMVRYSSALKQLASVLFKLASDFKILGSGPRCGFNEWQLPANEPGSSIMPGKVNPTQCEALSMVCLQVFGNDLTVSLAASNGQLQLNTYRPVIIHNVMQSIALLGDAMDSFANNCVSGLALNHKQISTNLSRNLSLVTLLAPSIGYDTAAQIARKANKDDTSLAQAAEGLGLFTQQEFERLLNKMLA